MRKFSKGRLKNLEVTNSRCWTPSVRVSMYPFTKFFSRLKRVSQNKSTFSKKALAQGGSRPPGPLCAHTWPAPTDQWKLVITLWSTIAPDWGTSVSGQFVVHNSSPAQFVTHNLSLLISSPAQFVSCTVCRHTAMHFVLPFV